MKNPLRYQITEYDCGPTSMLNAISYLFDRESIPPELVRNIMLYSLDCFGDNGAEGKSGTSRMAMMFLSNWINGLGEAGHLPVSSRHLSGEAVNLGQSSDICDALRRGGAVVVLVDFDGWHYVLLTGLDNKQVYLFDPYYREEAFEDANIRIIENSPFTYNRIVPASYLERQELAPYAMGPIAGREAVLLFNQQTKQTMEKTIEYII